MHVYLCLCSHTHTHKCMYLCVNVNTYACMQACMQACILTCMHAYIGSITFAGRFFLISMHPMKLNGTMMNSFLFNVMQLLLCSISCVQVMCARVRACVRAFVCLSLYVYARARARGCMGHTYVCVCMDAHTYTSISEASFQRPPNLSFSFALRT